jgi:hypothetical protein
VNDCAGRRFFRDRPQRFNGVHRTSDTKSVLRSQGTQYSAAFMLLVCDDQHHAILTHFDQPTTAM